jgi:hypothetical protein
MLAVVGFGSFPTPSPASRLDGRHTGRLRKRDNLLRGEGVGEEPNNTTARNLGPLYSILSAQNQPVHINGGMKVVQEPT